MPELRIVSRPDLRAELAHLRTKDLNFETGELNDDAREPGWFLDDYRQALPPEPPGPPVEGGSWEVARRLSRSMEFFDPALVRAFYDPRDPFVGRTMVLEVRFSWLRVYAGVRIGGLEDLTGDREAGRARVWAWNYRTLEDHFEVGQIDYQVWKWLDSGDVEFRIHALSKPAEIDHFFIALGFRMFGRSTQKRFARHACQRMASLTSERLARGRTGSHSRA
ncbi:MAG: DUF1990 domain-containing protein [Actinomycetota bacterium]|nr:DUF1990 domain-containing protein [Actinomycetota bacterium]